MASSTHQPHLSTALDPRAVRTREALRTALLELLEQKPLDQITIRDIAATAGISYVTFFRHHPTKEALLHDIAAEQVRRLIDLMMPSMVVSETRTAALDLCNYVHEHRKLWSTLLTGGAASVLREEFLRLCLEASAGVADHKAWLPPELAITLNVSSTIELLAWWLRQKRPISIGRMAEIHERVIMMPTIAADRQWARRAKARRSGKR